MLYLLHAMVQFTAISYWSDVRVFHTVLKLM